MEAAAKRGTLLFVDDERRVLTSMRAMFRRDYEVLLANSGQEAIDLLRDHSVDVIVSDQRMPGMTGVEVLKAVKRLAPNAMRILLTGYADLQAIEASINEGEVFRYLTKPCPSEQLKEAIGLAAEVATHAEPHVAGSAPLPVMQEAAKPAERCCGCAARRRRTTAAWQCRNTRRRAGPASADGAALQPGTGFACELAADPDSAPARAEGCPRAGHSPAREPPVRTSTTSIC